MKKGWALTAMLLLLTVTLLGCGDNYRKETAALQGVWQGEVDVTEQANRELHQCFASLIGQHSDDALVSDVLRGFDTLTLTARWEFYDDGTCCLTAAEDSVQQCFREARNRCKGMVADYCRRFLDASGIDMLPEDLVAEAGLPLDRVDEQLDERFDAPAVQKMLEQLQQKWHYTVTAEGLHLTAPADGAQEEAISVPYTLEEGTLTLHPAEEGTLPAFCPTRFQRAA